MTIEQPKHKGAGNRPFFVVEAITSVVVPNENMIATWGDHFDWNDMISINDDVRILVKDAETFNGIKFV